MLCAMLVILAWLVLGTLLGLLVMFVAGRLLGARRGWVALLVSGIIGADGLVQFSDDERVDELMAYLVSPDGGREWAKRGGYLSARTSVDPDTYYTDTDRQFAEVLLDGRELRFDASDLMPPEIGSGLLWREITAWVAGTSSLDSFVTTIDDAIAASDTP